MIFLMEIGNENTYSVFREAYFVCGKIKYTCSSNLFTADDCVSLLFELFCTTLLIFIIYNAQFL
jgi:hypothetical protein